MRNMKKKKIQRLKLTARRCDVSELKYDEHKYYFSCSEETGSRLKMLWCLKRIYLGILTLCYFTRVRIESSYVDICNVLIGIGGPNCRTTNTVLQMYE